MEKVKRCEYFPDSLYIYLSERFHKPKSILYDYPLLAALLDWSTLRQKWLTEILDLDDDDSTYI